MRLRRNMDVVAVNLKPFSVRSELRYVLIGRMRKLGPEINIKSEKVLTLQPEVALDMTEAYPAVLLYSSLGLQIS